MIAPTPTRGSESEPTACAAPGDLHLHTHYSDGTYSPEELAGHAARVGLGTIALTDHDTTEGCAATAAACARLGIRFVAGTELTAEIGGIELHLLGYGIDTDNADLARETGRFQQVRQDRIREMAARLNAVGVPLRAEAVFELANCRSPGRPHVARALVQARLCPSVDEAFDRFLKKDRPAWVPKCKMSALEAIRLIHGAGGLAVLAHPGINRCDDLVPGLMEAGLDGIECFHSKHTAAQTRRYLQLAETNHLVVTGGSDCHGMSKGKPLIGTVVLPPERLQELLERMTAAAGRGQAASACTETDISHGTF